MEYLGDVVTLDLDDLDRQPDRDLDHRRERDGDLKLAVAGFLIAVIVGVSIGLLAGRYRDTWIDVSGRMFGIVIYFPVFFLGFLLQLLFGSVLGWLPTTRRASPVVEIQLDKISHFYLLDAVLTWNWSAFWDVLQHLILPAVTLGLVTSGVLIRLVRVNLLQTMRGDYVEAARARGVSERRVVVHHAFRNALVPVVTVAGLQFAILLGGVVLTEQTFNWPGFGSRACPLPGRARLHRGPRGSSRSSHCSWS